MGNNYCEERPTQIKSAGVASNRVHLKQRDSNERELSDRIKPQWAVRLATWPSARSNDATVRRVWHGFTKVTVSSFVEPPRGPERGILSL